MECVEERGQRFFTRRESLRLGPRHDPLAASDTLPLVSQQTPPNRIPRRPFLPPARCFFPTTAMLNESPDDLWNELRASSKPLSLASLRPYLYNADGETKASSVNHFIDSFALHSRLDAVDENGVPFLPFMRDLNRLELDALKYGVLVSAAQHTLFVYHDFKTPLHDFYERESASDVSAVTGQDAPQPSSADDIDRIRREAQARGAAAAQAAIQRKFHVWQAEHTFFLFRIQRIAVSETPRLSDVRRRVILGPHAGDVDASCGVPPPNDSTQEEVDRKKVQQVAVLPMFALTFRNVGEDDSVANARYRLSAVQVTGHRYWEIHKDCRAEKNQGPTLDYYSRFSVDTQEALRLREEAWSAWCDMTNGSVSVSPARSRPASHEGHRIPTSSQHNNNYHLSDNVERSKQFAAEMGSLLDVMQTGYVQDGSQPVALTPALGRHVRDFVPRRCTYTVDRMFSRLAVMPTATSQRPAISRQMSPSAFIRQEWERLCESLQLNARTECATIVFKDTRLGVNRFEDGELCAFLPTDAETSRLAVCRTQSEEQLRLWVVKALVTAHQLGLHQLLIRMDLPWFLGRCAQIATIANNNGHQSDDEKGGANFATSTPGRHRSSFVVRETADGSAVATDGLAANNNKDDADDNQTLTRALSGGGGADANAPASQSNARYRCVSMIVRATEDFVRRSGVVWRVVFAALEDGASGESVESMIRSELANVQKEVWEREEQGKTSTDAVSQRDVVNGEALMKRTPSKPAKQTDASPRPKTRHGDSVVSITPGRGIIATTTAGGGVVPSPLQKQSASPSKTIMMRGPVMTGVENPIIAASLQGKPLTEQSMMALFRRLDVDKSGYLSAAEIKRVFLKEETRFDDSELRTDRGTIAPKKSQPNYLAPGNVLNPLDACGLPWDAKAVDQFVSKFCRQNPGRMSYPEFSIMMLELARR